MRWGRLILCYGLALLLATSLVEFFDLRGVAELLIWIASCYALPISMSRAGFPIWEVSRERS